MCERLDAMRRKLLEEQEERRRMEEDLREAEHLASIGRFSAALAHEIGTPLNVISGRAELLLRRGVGGEAGQRNLGIIATQIDRITRIVRGMLDFARARELRLAPTRLGDVMSRVTELMEHRFQESGIELEMRWLEELPPIPADADQLHEVFLNLAMNAADAMPEGGTLTIAARRVEQRLPGHEGDTGPLLAVTFEDTGQGIRPEHLDRIFDPFFTTKEVGQGTGLGLSVSYGIVKEHGGWIEVESAVGRGTRVTVYLPLAPAAAEQAPVIAELQPS
jgi:signal transduction histidine kinase